MMPLWPADVPMPDIVLMMKAAGIVLMMNWSMKACDSCRSSPHPGRRILVDHRRALAHG
jgi:hypothetical protein